MKSRYIIVSEGFNFGRPCLRESKIGTAAIYDRFLRGETSEQLWKDYGIDSHQIDCALRFEIKQRARKAKEVKRELKNLSEVARKAVKLLDSEMVLPPSLERGKRIAKITNALDTQNQLARRFGLQ